MGGYVAFEILRRAPERVTRLALLSTSAAPDGPRRAARRRAAMDSIRFGRFAGVTRRLLPQLVHLDRVESEAFLWQQTAILGGPHSRPLLASIAVPTLVGVDDADETTPPHRAEEIHRGIAGSVLHVFRHCGHLPPMELPEETTDVLRRWLSET